MPLIEVADTLRRTSVLIESIGYVSLTRYLLNCYQSVTLHMTMVILSKDSHSFKKSPKQVTSGKWTARVGRYKTYNLQFFLNLFCVLPKNTHTCLRVFVV